MYSIHLDIDPDTPEGRVIELVVQTEHVSPGEAVRNLLRQRARQTPAEAMLGAFSSTEDAALLDEAMALARKRREFDQLRDLDL